MISERVRRAQCCGGHDSFSEAAAPRSDQNRRSVVANEQIGVVGLPRQLAETRFPRNKGQGCRLLRSKVVAQLRLGVAEAEAQTFLANEGLDRTPVRLDCAVCKFGRQTLRRERTRLKPLAQPCRRLPDRVRDLRPPIGAGATEPVSRFRFTHFGTHDGSIPIPSA